MNEKEGTPREDIADIYRMANLRYGDSGEGWLELDEDTDRFITFEEPTITTTLLSGEESTRLINELDRIESIITPAINKLKIESGGISQASLRDLSPENQELLQTQEDLETLLKELDGLKSFEAGLKRREEVSGALTVSARLLQEKERRENNIRNLIQNNTAIRTLLGNS